MRIGVNALYLIPGGVGGTEIYLRNLLRALAAIDSSNEYFVITNQETGGAITPTAAVNFQTLTQGLRAEVRPWRLFWEQTGLPSLARDLKLDVLFNPGFTAPFVSPCPTVTVFHDLQHKRHPEYFRWWDLPFWRFFLYWSARRSTRLVAVSDATREDLLRFYPLKPDRIAVAPHGVEEEFFEIGKRRGETDPYILCVSTLHPHKNLDRLVRAFRHVSPHRLVITGLRGLHTEALERNIAALGLGGRVELTGWIPREDLHRLFERAAAFIYPSTFEGFGMPVLEALAAGVPAAVSGIEPMKSIAGDAALLFDPLDDEAIARALNRLISDDALRQRLAAAGPARAAQFRWKDAAARTLAVLKQAAETAQ
jgi:glycosyltransferase involved in cell wall biosynthesis